MPASEPRHWFWSLPLPASVSSLTTQRCRQKRKRFAVGECRVPPCLGYTQSGGQEVTRNSSPSRTTHKKEIGINWADVSRGFNRRNKLHEIWLAAVANSSVSRARACRVRACMCVLTGASF